MIVALKMEGKVLSGANFGMEKNLGTFTENVKGKKKG